MLETLQVTLVTPAMIGGVERSSCDDPAIVRPPAIRGMLHFWTRALCDKDHYREVEVDLWGSTERGQGISISTRQSPCQREERPLFPHHQGGRRVETTMMLPNPKPIELRFRLLHGQHREKLQAVVWTWLHLGSVGRRARRGYGSLLWHPREGDLLSDFVDFDHDTDLASKAALEGYLEKGLKQVERVMGRPSSRQARVSKNDRFQLATINQVFVGKVLKAKYDKSRTGMEFLIHGMDPIKRSRNRHEANQMGKALGGRLASPMMWRLFPCTQGGYIPVMTWSPREGVTRISRRVGMYDYLHGTLGFSDSLGGNPL